MATTAIAIAKTGELLSGSTPTNTFTSVQYSTPPPVCSQLRMRFHEPSKIYVARCTAEGKTKGTSSAD
ncbi:hypothetical protein J7E69_00365 [Rhodococcus enclensis]|nr:hypothetical protein [Rhodococcus qingshengii]